MEEEILDIKRENYKLRKENFELIQDNTRLQEEITNLNLTRQREIINWVKDLKYVMDQAYYHSGLSFPDIREKYNLEIKKESN